MQLADTLATASLAGETMELVNIQTHPSIAALSLYKPDLDHLLGRSDIVINAMRAVA